MSDEKNLIKRIKNSFDVGFSRAEITRKLQDKGYKLEYIDLMINKSRKGKRFFVRFLFVLVFLFGLLSLFSIFFVLPDSDIRLINPISGSVIFNNIENQLDSGVVGFGFDGLEEINNKFENIEINEDFITYILQEINAWKLHKNVLTGEVAVISFVVSEENYYSVIDNGKIETFSGSRFGDIEISTSKEEIVRAILSENPRDYVFLSIETEKTKTKRISGKIDLLAKGYYDFASNFNGI